MGYAAAFRAMHDGPGCFVMPNPWDPGSARIFAHQGFPALATSSAGMAFALGLRDGQTSWAQRIDHCREMAGAVDLPVSGDLEMGIGHAPETAAETVRAALDAGLAGLSIEDHGGDPADPIYGFDLAVERVAAAAQARDAASGDIVLTARAEGFLWGWRDLDAVIRRLQAFERAGADVLFAPGLPDLAAVETVCASLSRPVSVLAGAGWRREEIAAAGAKRISIGSGVARLAYGHVIRAGEAMAEGRFDFSAEAIGFEALGRYFD